MSFLALERHWNAQPHARGQCVDKIALVGVVHRVCHFKQRKVIPQESAAPDTVQRHAARARRRQHHPPIKRLAAGSHASLVLQLLRPSAQVGAVARSERAQQTAGRRVTVTVTCVGGLGYGEHVLVAAAAAQLYIAAAPCVGYSEEHASRRANGHA